MRQRPLPAEADELSLEFGPDQNGDPAVWLVFKLRPLLQTTPATYDALHSYAHSIRSDLLDADVERFPYVRILRNSSHQSA